MAPDKTRFTKEDIFRDDVVPVRFICWTTVLRIKTKPDLGHDYKGEHFSKCIEAEMASDLFSKAYIEPESALVSEAEMEGYRGRTQLVRKCLKRMIMDLSFPNMSWEIYAVKRIEGMISETEWWSPFQQSDFLKKIPLCLHEPIFAAYGARSASVENYVLIRWSVEVDLQGFHDVLELWKRQEDERKWVVVSEGQRKTGSGVGHSFHIVQKIEYIS